jgi:CRP-like cAMP-binding protein
LKNFLPYLKTLAFFDGLPDDTILGLTTRFARQRLADGEVLYEPGDPKGSAFVIVRGELEVLSAGGQRMAVLKAGEAVGLHELFVDEPRATLIRAIGETGLFEIDRATFAAACEAIEPIDAALVERVAHLLAIQLREIDGVLARVDPPVIVAPAPRFEAPPLPAPNAPLPGRSALRAAAAPRMEALKDATDADIMARIDEIADRAGLSDLDSVKVVYGDEQPLRTNPSSIIRRG